MIAALLPIACTGIAKWGLKGYDNNRPREWLARQEGWRGRANAAQQNSWEAFAIFSAAVLTAHVAGAPQPTVDAIAVAFVSTRLLYIWCYVMDFANLRSLVWLVGLGLSISLFVISA
jgi:uncharacterized MAPEG superfamily protein